MNDEINDTVYLRVLPQGEYTLLEAVNLIDEQYTHHRDNGSSTRFRLELNVSRTVAAEIFSHPSLLGNSDLVLIASEVPWALGQ